MKGEKFKIGRRPLVIASIIFAVVVIAILVAIFNGRANTRPDSDVLTTISVTDIRDNRVVRMSVEGPIVAKEDRQSYQIEISPTHRTLKVISGYDGSVVATKSYDNTRAAYQEFVTALEQADLQATRASGSEDSTGACPAGQRYVFEIVDSGQSAFRTWTSSCNNTQGTLNASRRALETLFERQIPSHRSVFNELDI